MQITGVVQDKKVNNRRVEEQCKKKQECSAEFTNVLTIPVKQKSDQTQTGHVLWGFLHATPFDSINTVMGCLVGSQVERTSKRCLQSQEISMLTLFNWRPNWNCTNAMTIVRKTDKETTTPKHESFMDVQNSLTRLS